MNINDIAQIEDFLIKNVEKTLGAASRMTDIIGALIDLKPAAVVGFSSSEMKKIDCLEFKEMLEKVGLKCVFYYRQMLSFNKLEWHEEIFISKDFNTAVKLRNAFIQMWASLDDFGQVIDQKTRVKATRQIGKTLGYPNTAIGSFIRNETEHRSGDDSLTVIGGRCKFFAHSKKHLEKELKSYDRPLDEAVKKYAPKSYKLSKTMV